MRFFHFLAWTSAALALTAVPVSPVVDDTGLDVRDAALEDDRFWHKVEVRGDEAPTHSLAKRTYSRQNIQLPRVANPENLHIGSVVLSYITKRRTIKLEDGGEQVTWYTERLTFANGFSKPVRVRIVATDGREWFDRSVPAGQSMGCWPLGDCQSFDFWVYLSRS